MTGSEFIRAVAAKRYGPDAAPELNDYDRTALGALALQGEAMQRPSVRDEADSRASREWAWRFTVGHLAQVLGDDPREVADCYDRWFRFACDYGSAGVTRHGRALFGALCDCLERFWPKVRPSTVLGTIERMGRVLHRKGESTAIGNVEARMRVREALLLGQGVDLVYIDKRGVYQLGRQTREVVLRNDKSVRRQRPDRAPNARVIPSDRLDSLAARIEDCGESLDNLDMAQAALDAEIAAFAEQALARAAKAKPGSKRRLVLEHVGELLAGKLSIRGLAQRWNNNRGKSALQRIYNPERAAFWRKLGHSKKRGATR